MTWTIRHLHLLLASVVAMCGFLGCGDDWKAADAETADWQADPPKGTVSLMANFERLAKKHPELSENNADFEKWKSEAKGHEIFARPDDLSLLTRYFSTTSKTRVDDCLKSLKNGESGRTEPGGGMPQGFIKDRITLGKRQWFRFTTLQGSMGGFIGMFKHESKQPKAATIEYEHCNDHKVWVLRAEAIPPGDLSGWYAVLEDSLRSATLIDLSP